MINEEEAVTEPNDNAPIHPIPQEAFDWYDEYAHGLIDRRTFMERLATENDGVFSVWNGHNPRNRAPRRLNSTTSPMTRTGGQSTLVEASDLESPTGSAAETS